MNFRCTSEYGQREGEVRTVKAICREKAETPDTSIVLEHNKFLSDAHCNVAGRSESLPSFHAAGCWCIEDIEEGTSWWNPLSYRFFLFYPFFFSFIVFQSAVLSAVQAQLRHSVAIVPQISNTTVIIQVQVRYAIKKTKHKWDHIAQVE